MGLHMQNQTHKHMAGWAYTCRPDTRTRWSQVHCIALQRGKHDTICRKTGEQAGSAQFADSLEDLTQILQTVRESVLK
jgi:hypothetical protein